MLEANLNFGDKETIKGPVAPSRSWGGELETLPNHTGPRKLTEKVVFLIWFTYKKDIISILAD